MASTVFPAASGGLAVSRFPAVAGAPFNIPAGLTLQNTITTTTTLTTLPAQVWAVIIGGGGSGASRVSSAVNGSGGGGGVKIGWVDVPSTGITATIGAGGAAGVATTNASGARGGATIFGSIMSSGGGGGCQNGESVFITAVAQPHGEGLAGYGGNANSVTLLPNLNSFVSLPAGAPYGFTQGTFTAVSNATNSLVAVTGNLTRNWDNYLGGGAGGSDGIRNAGGSGFTGGGAASAATGGNSSRDGGLTNTFTGGTAPSATGGGGGAGFLANGSNAVTITGGAGGSGAGGGGCSGANGAGGAGGNGCVLIYY